MDKDFEVRDAEGNKVHPTALDKEAAAFWGVEYIPSSFASPVPIDETETPAKRLRNKRERLLLSWFSIIVGGILHSETDDWEGARKYIRELFEEYDSDKSDEYRDKFIDLINHWESKNYTPHKI